MQLKLFTPISKDILKQGKSYPFNVYTEVEEKIFSILLKANEVFEQNKENLLLNRNILTLYIKAEKKNLYQAYLETHIQTILEDPSVNLDTKTSFINQMASTTMNDLFEKEISSKNIVQVNSIIDNSVHLILKDSKAMYSMLKVTSYDYYTYTHCIDVASYAIGFGVFLALDKQELITLGKAAMLHDIGKKDIDHDIITKNGILTYEEFEIIKQHPQLSVAILKKVGETDETLLKIIEQHHEKEDGSGYPYGLKNDEIHHLAKIVSICDIFNALTTRRTYKDPMTSFYAFNIMFEDMKHQLCQKSLKKFVKFMGYNEKIYS
ncbi:MAG: HD domain-containing phosphohydrolase [Arcobacteraceae bacterium]